MSITFERTWETYRMAERFMPVKAAPVVSQKVKCVIDVCDEFDLVLLDAYGVLHDGIRAIDGALESFAELRKRGIAVYVISNGPSRSREQMVKTYRKMGYDFTVDEVSNSAMQVKVLAKDFRVTGWEINSPEEPMEWPERPLPQGNHTGLVYGEPQVDIFKTYVDAKRPIIVSNPDVAAPVGGELSNEPGEDAFWALHQNPKLPIAFSGKPYPQVFEAALAKFAHIPRQRVLMVGDTLHTDILGARHVGIQAMLVKSGLFKGRDIDSYIEECDITPEFIAEHL